MLNKKFLKHIRIYKTFKYNLYRQSSIELYKIIIEIAFFIKGIKENIEYLEEDEIANITNAITSMENRFAVENFFSNNYDFIYISPEENKKLSTVELIIDTNMQSIYELFKRFDRTEDLNSLLKERKEFYESLIELRDTLIMESSFIPEKRMKKIRILQKLLKEI